LTVTAAESVRWDKAIDTDRLKPTSSCFGKYLAADTTEANDGNIECGHK
jgi:hypothetical protein